MCSFRQSRATWIFLKLPPPSSVSNKELCIEIYAAFISFYFLKYIAYIPDFMDCSAGTLIQRGLGGLRTQQFAATRAERAVEYLEHGTNDKH